MEDIQKHRYFMNLALEQAQKAFQLSEVPVGAVIVKNGKVLSQSHNFRKTKQNPLNHAEILSLVEASQKLNSWRLGDCELYVSLEPCLMCMGAIIQARIGHLIYACTEPKEGFSSYYALDKLDTWKHKIKITSGIGAEESSILLKSFFKKLRN